MTDPVRVGLVGCGRLAERGYLPALARLDIVSLVAVADSDRTRREAIAPRLAAFATASELLAAADVELLVLAHGAVAHVADARAAAEAGVTSLVEKPPALTAEEATSLVGLEPSAWVGFNRRFEPAMTAMRLQLEAAPPAALELELSILPSAWDAFGGSESALLDLGPHVVDLALWLTGCAPLRVRVRHVSERGASFDLDVGDAIARLRISHAHGWHERVVARDAAGRVTARVDRGGLLRRLAARARPSSSGPLVDSLAEQLGSVAMVVRGAAPDPRLARAADAVAVMTVLDAVAAAEADEWVPL